MGERLVGITGGETAIVFQKPGSEVLLVTVWDSKVDDTFCNWADGQICVSVPMGNEGVFPGNVGKGTISSAAGVRISKPLGIGGIGAGILVSA